MKGKPAKGKAATAQAMTKKPASSSKTAKPKKPAPSKTPAKTVNPPIPAIKAGKSKPAHVASKPAHSASKPAPAASKSVNKTSFKEPPVKTATPSAKNKSTTPSQSKAAVPPGKSGRTKGQKAGKTALPNKLVQVIPAHKPSMLSTAPVKKEKMLMRFGKPTKRVLFTVDFLLKASPTIVYHFITTPSALVRWFCDAVDITGEYYTFSWKGNTEVAEVIDDIEDERLRFHWLDSEDEDEYFEFRITTADITDETILEIVDFAWADEDEEQRQLWRTQVERLRKETGDA